MKPETRDSKSPIRNILIVDDMKENLLLLEALLTEYGYNVVSAINGKDALEKLRINKKFDLIISDILMPIMDGFRLCREVKEDEKFRDIPLVFHTASYTSERDEEFALKLGADKYIRKPIESDKFLKIIQDLLKDADKGKVMSCEIVLEDDYEMLKIYSERVVVKLERKILELENEITRHKLTQEKLKESEKKFRTICATANDAVILADGNGYILYWNKASEKIFGFTSEEIIGKNLSETIVPDRFREDHAKGIKAFRETGQGPLIGKSVELIAARKDGTEFPIEHSVSAVKLHETWHSIGIIRDITERRNIEEQLVVSRKMAALGQLAAGVFHEILNPVNIISSHVQLLLMKTEKGSGIENDLHSILEEIGRIVKITDGLLRYSRKPDRVIEKIDINSLLEKTVSAIKPEMERHNINLEIRLEETLPKIMANSDGLRQVFLNLMSNARDAMPDGGTITVSTQSTRKPGTPSVRIRVTDTGCGIDKKDVDKIFEPFFTTKNTGKGVGLGLSILYTIIENHRGTIRVESEVGKGTTFIIDLPVEV